MTNPIEAQPDPSFVEETPEEFAAQPDPDFRRVPVEGVEEEPADERADQKSADPEPLEDPA
ncbi:hypothetical protein F4553_002138 [Allocatelliglobosispora scoriae]|uniref:Uncharacterized protein n=1 Tax=Allocatelliglobosispora scoriae TaxID=643052 RepID=A0A841BNI5_9ACTN|nr:hypothetical protein [Allocatelliglobosispora scoriae]MBB5868759.1 hypothetical protein [Allocatelliglobosispora scoriae]